MTFYGSINENLKNLMLQTRRRKFESLKLKDEENIASYFLCVDEIVNIMNGLGKKVKESMII